MPATEFYTSFMARDVIHDAVKNALIKDGWTITAALSLLFLHP
jgi:hypothetical protein